MWCQLCFGCYPHFIWHLCFPVEAFLSSHSCPSQFLALSKLLFSLCMFFFSQPFCLPWHQVNFDLSSLSCSPQASFLAAFFPGILPLTLSRVCFYFCSYLFFCFVFKDFYSSLEFVLRKWEFSLLFFPPFLYHSIIDSLEQNHTYFGVQCA